MVTGQPRNFFGFGPSEDDQIDKPNDETTTAEYLTDQTSSTGENQLKIEFFDSL